MHIDEIKKKAEQISKVQKSLPGTDVMSSITEITEAFKEHQISAQREVAIKNIEEKYHGFYKHIFDKVFSERKQTIDKCFDVIDQGIEKGDNTIFASALASLSEVVSASPLANAAQLSAMLDKDEAIHIDI